MLRTFENIGRVGVGILVAIGVGVIMAAVNFSLLVGVRYLSTYTEWFSFPFDPQIILGEMVLVFVFLSIVLWGAAFARQIYDTRYKSDGSSTDA